MFNQVKSSNSAQQDRRTISE